MFVFEYDFLVKTSFSLDNFFLELISSLSFRESVHSIEIRKIGLNQAWTFFA